VVKNLCNQFLNHKQELVDVGEWSPRTWTEYRETWDQFVATFGKQRLVTDLAADDFVRLRCAAPVLN
jgi:hypothetical protein